MKVESSETKLKSIVKGEQDDASTIGIPTKAMEDSEDSDEYGTVDDFKDMLGDLLSSAFENQSNGNFASSGQLSDAPNPGLSISELGQIGLPLTPFEADRIIAHSELAPFGKMDETIVDPTVRRTWQIDGSKIQFLNPTWAVYLQNTILPRVGTELGVSGGSIDAHLYKLLLYGEGGHFDLHQDTEKEARMFGTLVIILPSLHTGGQVTVSHGAQELVFDTALNSAFGTSFTCLYTDVFHKVHPVSSGYRFALSYNLVLKTSSVPVPHAPLANGEMLEIRTMFLAWLNRLKRGEDAPDFIAHILDHRYSKFGLSSFSNMKGEDKPKIAFLKDMAQELGFSIYLAQFDIHVHGSGMGLDAGYGYGSRWGRYGGSPEDTMDDECDQTRMYTLKEAIAPDGTEFSLNKLVLREQDTTPTFNLNEWNIDKKECEGYQGNYAGSVDHYYYRTVVLLWPKDSDLAMTIRGGGSQYAAQRLQSVLQKFVDAAPAATAQYRLDLERTARAVPLDHNCTPAVARAALALEDRQIWARFNSSLHWQRVDWGVLVRAMQKFGSEFVRSLLDDALKLAVPPGTPDMWGASKDTTVETLAARGNIIIQIRKAFAGDGVATSWADQHVDRLLKDLSTTPTTTVIELAVIHVKNVGFVHGVDVLSNMMKQLCQPAPQPRYPYGYSRSGTIILPSPLGLIVPVLVNLSGEHEAVAWIERSLTEFLSTRETLQPGEAAHLARAAVAALHVSQSLLLKMLIACRRNQYTPGYLVGTIQPLADALRSSLAQTSSSLISDEFADFTMHFLSWGNQILRKAEPALPPDHTLPTVDNYRVDKFLASSVQHVLRIRDNAGVRDQVERSLSPLTRQQKLALETIKGQRPNTLVIRKTRPLPPMPVPLKTLVTEEAKKEWANASRTCSPPCGTCIALGKCLTWLDGESAAEKYFQAFGQAALGWFEKKKRSSNSSDVGGPAILPSSAMSSTPAGSTTAQGSGHGSAAIGQKRKVVDVIDLTEDDRGPPPGKSAKLRTSP